MNGRHKPIKQLVKRKRKYKPQHEYVFPSEIVKAFNIIKTWAEGITAGHIKKREGRGWTVPEQLCHIQSEIAEVYEAMRWSKCDKEISEEMVDVVFSGFTLFNIYRFNKLRDLSKTEYNKLIDEAVKTVQRRVTERLNDKNYNMGSKVGKLEE